MTSKSNWNRRPVRRFFNGSPLGPDRDFTMDDVDGLPNRGEREQFRTHGSSEWLRGMWWHSCRTRLQLPDKFSLEKVLWQAENESLFQLPRQDHFYNASVILKQFLWPCSDSYCHILTTSTSLFTVQIQTKTSLEYMNVSNFPIRPCKKHVCVISDVEGESWLRIQLILNHST
jgi:hypothetical protein